MPIKLTYYEFDYEAERPIFSTEGSPSFIVEGSTRVIYEGFLTFVQDGKITGQLDAEFDFSSLAHSLHDVGIQMIQRQSTQLNLPRRW